MAPPRNRYSIYLSNGKKKAAQALNVASVNPHQLANGQQSAKEVMLGPDDCRQNFIIVMANRNPEMNGVNEEGIKEVKIASSKKSRKSKRNKQNKKSHKQAEAAKIDDAEKEDAASDQKNSRNSAMA